MKTATIRDLFKELNIGIEKFYAGKLDAKYEKSICVYQLKDEYTKTIGGTETEKTLDKTFSILIHWNKNYTQTEEAANLIYETIEQIRNKETTEGRINFVEMMSGSPIDLHSDENGIYERLFDIKIYYNKLNSRGE